MRERRGRRDYHRGRRHEALVRSDDASCETLDQARRGDRLEIVEIDDERARMTALRFGMAEGAQVSCAVRIPAGPIVVRSGRQEVAVGRGLARRIRVRRLGRSGRDE